MLLVALRAAPGATAQEVLDEALPAGAEPCAAVFQTTEPSVACLAGGEQEPGDETGDRDWRWRMPDFRYSPARARAQPGYVGSYCMDGLAMALHVVYSTTSFRAALLKAANLCGDADSVAAVAGQIAGAIYGADQIPAEWVAAVQQWDRGGDIALRAYKLYHGRALDRPGAASPKSRVV